MKDPYKVTYTVRGRKFTTVFDTEEARDKFIAAVERAKDYDVVKEADSSRSCTVGKVC